MPSKTTRPTLDDLFASKDQAMQVSDARFLSGPEKDALARNGTPFTVKRVTMGSGDFGARWELLIDLSGEDVILTIPRNKGRDDLMRGLQDHARRAPLSGITLTKDERDDGTSFYWFGRVAAQDRLI